MIGIFVALSPIVGMASSMLAAFFCALKLLGASHALAFAASMTLATSGACCALLGHYIGMSSGNSGYSKLYARFGGVVGIGLIVTDSQAMDAIVRAVVTGDSHAISWTAAGWIGARMCVALCKVSLALAILVLAIEMPLQVLGGRGKSECLRVMAATRPYVLLGFIGITSGYLLSMWSDVIAPLTAR